jgi:hypothetical protein
VTDIPADPPGTLPPAPPLPPQPYQAPSGPGPIEVGFAGPAAQRRVTVFFRLILAIPQFIVLYVLVIAAEIVAVIGWFAALFTGRLPEFAVEFLSGVLRWQARVSAYYLLLTDQYPPFSLDDADYLVRVAARPGPLNRLAVLFRIILIIPAGIVVGVLTYGLETIAMFVVWLIVLINGRMPDALHAAISLVLRYTIRYLGYFFLLTSEYPGGLYGDQPGAAGPSGFPAGPGFPAAGYSPAAGPEPAAGFPSAAGYPPAPAQPPAEGYGRIPGTEDYQQVSGTGYGAPAYGAQTDSWSVPGSPPWRLAASQAAKHLITLFIVLGAILLAAYAVIVVTAVSNARTSTANRADALSHTNSAFSKLSVSMTKFGSQTTACRASKQQLRCVTAADSRASQAFADFARDQAAVDMPAGSPQQTASQLIAGAGRAQHIFQRLAASTSVAQYQQTATASGLQQVLDQIELAYRHLQATLING